MYIFHKCRFLYIWPRSSNKSDDLVISNPHGWLGKRIVINVQGCFVLITMRPRGVESERPQRCAVEGCCRLSGPGMVGRLRVAAIQQLVKERGRLSLIVRF